MKKILIISTSPRKNSNSEALAARFAKGATEAGNSVEQVSLTGKEIRFCQGCLACQKLGRCVMRDDADAIEQMAEQADVLVFATPIYYYEMSGQMKAMLDRCNAMYASDYRFREVYLIATAADVGDSTFRRAKAGLEGWIECFPKARLSGTLFAGGVDKAGEVQGTPAMEKALEMGRAV